MKVALSCQEMNGEMNEGGLRGLTGPFRQIKNPLKTFALRGRATSTDHVFVAAVTTS